MLRNTTNAYQLQLYLVIQFLEGLFFATIFTVNMVYQANTVGLTPLQLVLVGTLLELSVLVFEIPTGIVADVYSRKLSLLIGFALIGLGFIVEGSWPTFAAVLLAQVIWGLGATFTSGAYQAWLVDELPFTADAPPLEQVFVRGGQSAQLGSLLGAGLSVSLAGITIALPIVTGGVSFVVLSAVLAIIMPERGFSPAPKTERQTWAAMQGTIQTGVQAVQKRPILLTILGITFITGAFSEGYDRLWTPHLLDNFTFPSLLNLPTVVWFGVISVVGRLLSLFTAEVLRRRLVAVPGQNLLSLMMAFNLLISLSMLIFALSAWFWLALTMILTIGSLRSLLFPLYAAWLNRNIESGARATLLSLDGQANAIGQIAGGPMIGLVGNAWSLRAALGAAGLVLLPVLGLYQRGRRLTVSQAEATKGD